MSFTSLLNKNVTFLARLSGKSVYNMDSFTIASTGITVPCYLSKISAAQKRYGKDVVNYDAILYTDYSASVSGINTSDFVAEIDSKQYEIIEFQETFNNHHLEFLLSIVEDK
jgi:hypothetical protein